MLIPSIDLMGGKIVQLIQGERKVLESGDFDYWIERFSGFPLVQLIDLDAAMDNGNNRELIATICRRLACQVGGGIRTLERGRELLLCGARRIIFGSSLLTDGCVNPAFAEECARVLGADRVTFAIDSRAGKVAIKGWKQSTSIDPLAMMQELEGFCSAFLYTHIDSEGTMTGFPMKIARHLRGSTENKLMVAGGIRSMNEVHALDALNVDAVVGMAIYTGALVE